tara:strand:+ start:3230 stop:5167 length:1938 start_codon:yes stop_codon:yes gene_type:complete
MKKKINLVNLVIILIIILGVVLLVNCFGKNKTIENFDIKIENLDEFILTKYKKNSFFDNEMVIFRKNITPFAKMADFTINGKYFYDNETTTYSSNIKLNYYIVVDNQTPENSKTSELVGNLSDKLSGTDPINYHTLNKNNGKFNGSGFIQIPPTTLTSSFLELVITVSTNEIGGSDKIRLTDMKVKYEVSEDELNYVSSEFEQKSNIIFHKKNTGGKAFSKQDVQTSTSVSIRYAYEFNLKNYFYLDQIFIKNGNNTYLQFGIKNDEKNEINFVNLKNNDESLDVAQIDKNSKTYFDIVSARFRGDIFIDGIKDLYSNDLSGNKLIVFSSEEFNSNSEIIVTGHLVTENFDYKKYSGITEIDASEIKTLSENNIESHNANYLIKKIKIVSTVPSPTNEDAVYITSTNTNIRIKYKNSYSNNVIVYPGYNDDSSFHYYNNARTNDFYIFCIKNLVASEISIEQKTSTGYTKINAGITYYGELATSTDVNKFILDNNITDIKGSINPDLVCPNLGDFMDEQLTAETIMDAMNYQDKINQEKQKLVGNKENLLTLLEQSEDIKKLERMINKIKVIDKKDEEHENILSALMFKKNMADREALVKFLDKRIETRNKNKLDLDFNIYTENLGNDTDNTEETFLNLEDDMRI